jgi:uncharacterized protein
MAVGRAEASRSSKFGYVCRRCSRCCRNKRIQINPYELARLARARGETTREFRERWTPDAQGTALAQKEDGTCVFLGPQGCEVHADRPLVCRLYPLAHHAVANGGEYFTTLEGHPQSEGEFTNRGTVAEYLADQGAGPFMDAADAYFRWLRDAHKRLDLTAEAVTAGPGKDANCDLLDMDMMIARHCGASDLVEPIDLDERTLLHLQLLYEAIGDREDRHAQEKTSRSDEVIR